MLIARFLKFDRPPDITSLAIISFNPDVRREIALSRCRYFRAC